MAVDLGAACGAARVVHYRGRRVYLRAIRLRDVAAFIEELRAAYLAPFVRAAARMPSDIRRRVLQAAAAKARAANMLAADDPIGCGMTAHPAFARMAVRLLVDDSLTDDEADTLAEDELFRDIAACDGRPERRQPAQPGSADQSAVFGLLAERYGFTPTQVANMATDQLDMLVDAACGIRTDRATGRRVRPVSDAEAARLIAAKRQQQQRTAANVR